MLHRRQVLITGYGSALLGATAGLWPGGAAAQPTGDWGEPQGYPTGWGPAGQMSRWEGYPAYRAGNYSGGFEAMFRHHLIAAPAPAQPAAGNTRGRQLPLGVWTPQCSRLPGPMAGERSVDRASGPGLVRPLPLRARCDHAPDQLVHGQERDLAAGRHCVGPGPDPQPGRPAARLRARAAGHAARPNPAAPPAQHVQRHRREPGGARMAQQARSARRALQLQRTLPFDHGWWRNRARWGAGRSSAKPG